MVILLSMLMRMHDMKVRMSSGVHTGTQHTETMGFNVSVELDVTGGKVLECKFI